MKVFRCPEAIKISFPPIKGPKISQSTWIQAWTHGTCRSLLTLNFTIIKMVSKHRKMAWNQGYTCQIFGTCGLFIGPINFPWLKTNFDDIKSRHVANICHGWGPHPSKQLPLLLTARMVLIWNENLQYVPFNLIRVSPFDLKFFIQIPLCVGNNFVVWHFFRIHL